MSLQWQWQTYATKKIYKPTVLNFSTGVLPLTWTADNHVLVWINYFADAGIWICGEFDATIPSYYLNYYITTGNDGDINTLELHVQTDSSTWVTCFTNNIKICTTYPRYVAFYQNDINSAISFAPADFNNTIYTLQNIPFKYAQWPSNIPFYWDNIISIWAEEWLFVNDNVTFSNLDDYIALNYEVFKYKKDGKNYFIPLTNSISPITGATDLAVLKPNGALYLVNDTNILSNRSLVTNITERSSKTQDLSSIGANTYQIKSANPLILNKTSYHKETNIDPKIYLVTNNKRNFYSNNKPPKKNSPYVLYDDLTKLNDSAGSGLHLSSSIHISSKTNSIFYNVFWLDRYQLYCCGKIYAIPYDWKVVMGYQTADSAQWFESSLPIHTGVDPLNDNWNPSTGLKFYTATEYHTTQLTHDTQITNGHLENTQPVYNTINVSTIFNCLQWNHNNITNTISDVNERPFTERDYNIKIKQNFNCDCHFATSQDKQQAEFTYYSYSQFTLKLKNAWITQIQGRCLWPNYASISALTNTYDSDITIAYNSNINTDNSNTSRHVEFLKSAKHGQLSISWDSAKTVINRAAKVSDSFTSINYTHYFTPLNAFCAGAADGTGNYITKQYYDKTIQAYATRASYFKSDDWYIVHGFGTQLCFFQNLVSNTNPEAFCIVTYDPNA